MPTGKHPRADGLLATARSGALAVAAAALGLSALGGCTTDSGSGSLASATRVALAPATFLGELPCSAEPGAMRSYVVTLLAWNGLDDVTPFTVTASYPTSCARTVTFSTLVVPGSWYTAEVQGYDEPADTLEPFGGFSSGSSTMLNAETGEPVAPRWTTRCGNSAADGALAIQYETRFITRCDRLADASPTPTAIRFNPEQMFGTDGCEAIMNWGVQPDAPELPSATDLACDGPPLDYTDGVTPGKYYGFYVSAQRGPVAVGTDCFVVAREGVTVSPTCSPMTSDGYVELELQSLETNGVPVCPTGGRFDVLLDGAVLNTDPLPCEQPVRIGPLEPDDYALQAVVVDDLGAPTGAEASCTATVDPGRAVLAACSS